MRYQSTTDFLSQLLMWRKCALSGHYSLYIVELPPTSSSPLSSSLLFVSLLDQNLARLECRVLTFFWSPESSNQSPGFLLGFPSLLFVSPTRIDSGAQSLNSTRVRPSRYIVWFPPALVFSSPFFVSVIVSPPPQSLSPIEIGFVKREQLPSCGESHSTHSNNSYLQKPFHLTLFAKSLISLTYPNLQKVQYLCFSLIVVD